MKIKSFNTYKLSLFASLLLVYLLITNSMHWLVYVLVALIIVERAFVALLLWMVERMQKEMAKKLMDALAEAQKSGMPIRPPFDQEK